jgi:hypothetical protein
LDANPLKCWRYSKLPKMMKQYTNQLQYLLSITVYLSAEKLLGTAFDVLLRLGISLFPLKINALKNPCCNLFYIAARKKNYRERRTINSSIFIRK